MRRRRAGDGLHRSSRSGAVSAPSVRYADSDGIHIAYRVVGEGPLDLVHIAGAITNLDVLWEMAEYRRFVERLASFSRLIVFDCELVGDSVRGIAVHTGARVAAVASPGEVLVSQTVKDLVAGSGIDFADRGVHDLKGIPGEWRLYAVA